MRGFWDRLPVFWKIYALTATVVICVIAAVEGSEDFFGQLLSGRDGGELTDMQELVAWLLATLFATSVGSELLSRLFMDPLNRMLKVAERLAAGDLTARLDAADAGRPDEIGALNRTVNAMAGKLEHKFDTEHRLLAAVSHELRSPLTRMGLAVELLRRGEKARTNEPHLARLELEMARMNGLIASLQDYARRETDSLLPAAVDVCAVVRAVAADAAFEGQSRGCTVSTALPLACLVQGTEELLRRAVDNVVRNALRYTPAGTAVEVTLDTKEDNFCTLAVRDHGAGVPEAALADLFRPFYRVERARDRASGGIGLGLALVEQAVRLHGGTVDAINAPDGGLCVRLRLPRLQ